MNCCRVRLSQGQRKKQKGEATNESQPANFQSLNKHTENEYDESKLEEREEVKEGLLRRSRRLSSQARNDLNTNPGFQLNAGAPS